MANGKNHKHFEEQEVEPLPETLQMGPRVYMALRNSIVNGKIESGTPLRPDVIARQLKVSTTPVREALHRLENDGLAVKTPYQGWSVREFTDEQIRELYEVRAALECLAVRLACEKITSAEIDGLRSQQAVGEVALAAGDIDTYRIHDQDLHAAILKAAGNSYLCSVMGQLRPQQEMLIVRTARIAGRLLRSFEEHGRMIELIAQRQVEAVEQLMRAHIFGALKDLLGLHGDRPANRENESAERRLAAENR